MPHNRDVSSQAAETSPDITREPGEQNGKDDGTNQVVAALDAFHAKHGLLSDEFSAL